MRAAEARACIALVGAAAMVLVAAPRLARADGAFPDSQIILTPAARPREIILVTNFGLVQSEDAGATWLWSCEQVANLYGAYYQLGLPPRDRLYTLARSQVTFSDDRGCVWDVAHGLPLSEGGGVTDFWVDRTVTDRILAVETACCQAQQLGHALFESMDGGGTFPTTPLYQAAPGAMITGVESARTDPRTIYLTLLGAPTDGGSPPPMLARTSDGGLTWQVADLSSRLGPGMVRLVAVDPTDARKVFLLWSGVDGQALAVTGDGGGDARKILVPTGVLKAFLRLDSGAILVSADDRSTASLFRSTDGGETFASLPAPPHVRALSERAGMVYAATDNFAEGYAVGVSIDEGSTWTPLLAYEDVRGIVPCVKAACQSTCDVEVQLTLWSADVCSADVPMSSGGGGQGGPGGGSGTGGAAGRPGGSGAAAGGGSGARAGTGARQGGGCSCSSAPPTDPSAGRVTLGLGAAGLGALGLCLSTRRSRRRRARASL
jgi:hypothetical protein